VFFVHELQFARPFLVNTQTNRQVNTQQQGQDQEKARELKFVDEEHQETAEKNEFYAQLHAVQPV
jgi:hypothetical protein